MKKLLIMKIVMLLLCMCISSTIAEPVVEDVKIEPENPKALDSLTISATISSDEDIDEVEIKIKECDNNMCMPTEIYQMDLEDGKCTLTHKLSYSAATYFSYKFIITSNGNESETEYVNITLNPADKIETNGENGNGNNGIPIFAGIIILIVLIIGVAAFAIIRKKD